MSRSYNMLILPDTPGNMNTFLKILISMLYYFREMHIETNAVSKKSRPYVNVNTMHRMWRKSDAYVGPSKILAGNKTMPIIPDLTLILPPMIKNNVTNKISAFQIILIKLCEFVFPLIKVESNKRCLSCVAQAFCILNNTKFTSGFPMFCTLVRLIFCDHKQPSTSIVRPPTVLDVGRWRRVCTIYQPNIEIPRLFNFYAK